METKRPHFTFRQKEFARHYAQGQSAAKAALAAGYAASTAETNAARLLQNPLIAAYIQQHRKSRQSIRSEQVDRVLTRMLTIVEQKDNDDASMEAARIFLRLKEQQQRQGLGIEDEEALIQILDKADKFLALPATQNPGGQGTTQSFILLPDNVEETDTLPSGQPAFDVKIAPTRTEQTKTTEPLTIEFIPLTANQNPLPVGEGAGGGAQKRPRT